MEVSKSESDGGTQNVTGISKDILDDLCSRFLINIPREEKVDTVRICFQIELAHWFYLDFYRQEDPQLPGYGLQQFMEIIFKEFSFLKSESDNSQDLFNNWKKYKLEVPVYGAIMVDESLENCILVRGFSKRISWGFPKGKVNKDEDSVSCAVREVNEETGFDATKLIDKDEYLECNYHDHRILLYLVPSVPNSSHFKPKTRGEIKEIKWFPIDALPCHKKDSTPRQRLGLNANSFYMVQPFVKGLRKWVKRRKEEAATAPSSIYQKLPFTREEMREREEERLMKRKFEEQRKFHEIQLNKNPLLEGSTTTAIGSRVKPEKKAGKEKNGPGQSEAFRKLLNGALSMTHEKNEESLQQKGTMPHGYVESNKQVGALADRDYPPEKNSNSRPKTITCPSDESFLLAELKRNRRVDYGLRQQQSQFFKMQFSQTSLGFEKNAFPNAPKNVRSSLPSSRGLYYEEEADEQTKGKRDMKNSSGKHSKNNEVKSEKYSHQVKERVVSSQDEPFNVGIPEFLNFRFDIKALLATLPP